MTNQWTKKPQYPSGLSTARDCLLPTFLSLPSLVADSIMHSCVSIMHSCVTSLILCSCCRPQGNLKTIPFRRHQVRPGALCGRAHYEACPPHIQCPPEAQGLPLPSPSRPSPLFSFPHPAPPSSFFNFSHQPPLLIPPHPCLQGFADVLQEPFAAELAAENGNKRGEWAQRDGEEHLSPGTSKRPLTVPMAGQLASFTSGGQYRIHSDNSRTKDGLRRNYR